MRAEQDRRRESAAAEELYGCLSFVNGTTCCRASRDVADTGQKVAAPRADRAAILGTERVGLAQAFFGSLASLSLPRLCFHIFPSPSMVACSAKLCHLPAHSTPHLMAQYHAQRGPAYVKGFWLYYFSPQASALYPQKPAQLSLVTSHKGCFVFLRKKKPGDPSAALLCPLLSSAATAHPVFASWRDWQQEVEFCAEPQRNEMVNLKCKR